MKFIPIDVTKENLEKNLKENCILLSLNLSDSPASRASQINRQIGFYIGFCYSRAWQLNQELVGECESFI